MTINIIMNNIDNIINKSYIYITYNIYIFNHMLADLYLQVTSAATRCY